MKTTETHHLNPYDEATSDLVRDPDDINMRISLETRTIMIQCRCVAVDVYSSLLFRWKTENALFPHEFPMLAITREIFKMQHGWRILNPDMMYGGTLVQETER